MNPVHLRTRPQTHDYKGVCAWEFEKPSSSNSLCSTKNISQYKVSIMALVNTTAKSVSWYSLHTFCPILRNSANQFFTRTSPPSSSPLRNATKSLMPREFPTMEHACTFVMGGRLHEPSYTQIPCERTCNLASPYSMGSQNSTQLNILRCIGLVFFYIVFFFSSYWGSCLLVLVQL